MRGLLFGVYRLKTSLHALLTGQRPHDDFDWDFYTDHYRGELNAISLDHSTAIRPGDYQFTSGQLQICGSIRPLHPNHRLMYETILQLSPGDVTEMGCGGGDHLANLSVLSPRVRLAGVDVSDRQIALLRARHPHLAADILRFDLTSDPANELPQTDLAFTQAVLMHIQGRARFLRALANVFRVAREHVVMMENWSRHDFAAEIRCLSERGELGWDRVFLHYRCSPELGKPHILVASRAEIPQYPLLTDYALLRQGS